MSPQSTASRRAAVVAGTPLIMITAFALHPYLPGRQPNVEALAAAVSSDPTRWGLVHLATGLGSAVLAVAFLMIRTHLSRAGEDRWSRVGLPLVMVGCALYAMLPAMELAPLAAVESGGDPAAAQQALLAWFLPVLIAQRDHLRRRRRLFRRGRAAQRSAGAGTREAGRGIPGRHGAIPLRTPVSSPVLRAGPRLLRRLAAPGIFHVAAFSSITGRGRCVGADQREPWRLLTAAARRSIYSTSTRPIPVRARWRLV